MVDSAGIYKFQLGEKVHFWNFKIHSHWRIDGRIVRNSNFIDLIANFWKRPPLFWVPEAISVGNDHQ
jgi:hypothetical protein